MASLSFVVVVKLFLVGFLCICTSLSAETVQSEQRTILVLGDSISAAYRIDTESGWVSLLQRKLETEGSDWRVVNASVSGDTTLDGLTRIDALLDEISPQIMILELGANDGLRGYPVESIRENLIDLIDRAQSDGAFVILAGMQLPPNYGHRYVGPFKEMYEELAKTKNTGLIPFLMDGVAAVDELMQDDGLHPKAEGQPGLLANAWPVVQKHINEISETVD